MKSTRSLMVLLVLTLASLGSAQAVERLDPFPAYSPSEADAAAAQDALKAAAEALTAEKLAEAQRSARRAASLIPTSSAPLVLLAMIAEKGEHTAEAIDLYREALAWKPDDATALAALERLNAPRYADVTTQYEDQLAGLINQARQSCGLGTLKPHPALAEVARAHSAAMRDLNFLSHTSPKAGCAGAMDRFLKRFEGYPQHLAENLSRRYWRPTPALNGPNITLSHQELMLSPHHCSNILGAGFEYVGVGLAVNAEGDYWITELFMKPRASKETRLIIQQGGH